MESLSQKVFGIEKLKAYSGTIAKTVKKRFSEKVVKRMELQALSRKRI